MRISSLSFKDSNGLDSNAARSCKQVLVRPANCSGHTPVQNIVDRWPTLRLSPSPWSSILFRNSANTTLDRSSSPKRISEVALDAHISPAWLDEAAGDRRNQRAGRTSCHHASTPTYWALPQTRQSVYRHHCRLRILKVRPRDRQSLVYSAGWPECPLRCGTPRRLCLPPPT